MTKSAEKLDQGIGLNGSVSNEIVTVFILTRAGDHSLGGRRSLCERESSCSVDGKPDI